jgi:hypothetical protein
MESIYATGVEAALKPEPELEKDADADEPAE